MPITGEGSRVGNAADAAPGTFRAVDYAKQQRTKNAVNSFMRKLRTNLPLRIDVAEVTIIDEIDGEFKFDLNYIKNAF